MAGSDHDWAGNSVSWNPELPVFEPGGSPLLEAGSWTVPYSDFTPPASPFALELRAESIEQLVGGDALRRGESERTEAGRSGANADHVAGRDRVHVQGRLHEHTGHGLAEQVAHLDTAVDGRLDIHAGKEDTVLLAGHMTDVWDGGTAIVAAMTDDLVAGGGVRVTAPLDLWVHGLMGVEERIGTCTADAVLLELSGTHYEREYGPGVHAAGLAVYTGSLYQSSSSTFRPLMRVSSGVRNLIAGGGGGGAGGDPVASPPPVPAAGGAGTVAVSETLSAAAGSAQSVEAVVEAGARSDDLTGVRHFPDTSDAVRSEDIGPEPQALVAQLDDLMASLRREADELGDRAGAGSPSSAGSDWRVPQEGVELSDTQMGVVGEYLHTIDTMVAANSGDTSFFAHTDGFSGLAHPTDSAEQLDALKRGDTSGVGIPVPEFDRPPTERSDHPVWDVMFRELTVDLLDRRWSENQSAADAHQAAVDGITDKVLTTYYQFGGTADGLYPARSEITQAMTARRILEDMLVQAQQSGDSGRAADIRQALQEIDHHTYRTIAGLSDSASALGAQARPGTADAGVGPAMNEPATGGYETVGAWGFEPIDSGYEFIHEGSYRIASDSGSVSSLEGDSSLHSESAYNPPPMPTDTVVHVADSHGRVILGREAYENIQRGVVLLRVVDARGQEVAEGAYTLVVEGYEIAETGVLYRRVDRAVDGAAYGGVVDLSTSFLAGLDEDLPALPPRTPEALEILDPASLPPPAPADPDALRLADLTEVDETQVGRVAHGGSPDTNRGEHRVRFGPTTVFEYERPPADWHGGQPGTSSGQGGIGFGQPEVEGERPPGWQAGETPGFGRAAASPADEFRYPYSYREDLVQNLMSGKGLTEVDVEILELRFRTATASGEVDQSTGLWYSMAALVSGLRSQGSSGGNLSDLYGGSEYVDWKALDALLRLLDEPRPGRPF